MPTVKYGSLPFSEAISYFRNKQNIPTERWADLWQQGHNSGFTVAGAMADDLLNDFRRTVDIAIAEGKSIGWFKRNFKSLVAKHGWDHTGKANWRAKIIYNTNMRQSYNAGRWQQLQQFDYWQYFHGDSITPRPLHLSWHGLLLSKDHPWWLTHFPQNGWGCKCKVRGVSQKQLERKGLTPGRAPNDGSFDWTDKVTGEVHKVPKGIDPGFDYAPQKTKVIENQQQQQRKKSEPFVPPKRIAPTALSTVPGVNVHGLNKALEQMLDTSSKAQVEQLGEFLAKRDIKTVFIKQSQMSSKNIAAKKAVSEIEDYIGKHPVYRTIDLFTINQASRVHGFTSRAFDHVVIKASESAPISKSIINEVRQTVALAIDLTRQGHKPFTFTELLRKYGDGGESSALLSTWIHEIGHQVHYKAGRPLKPRGLGTMTKYANENDYEWHAELFSAWLLNRKALAEWNNDIAEYFDKLMQKAINP